MSNHPDRNEVPAGTDRENLEVLKFERENTQLKQELALEREVIAKRKDDQIQERFNKYNEQIDSKIKSIGMVKYKRLLLSLIAMVATVVLLTLAFLLFKQHQNEAYLTNKDANDHQNLVNMQSKVDNEHQALVNLQTKVDNVDRQQKVLETDGHGFIGQLAAVTESIKQLPVPPTIVSGSRVFPFTDYTNSAKLYSDGPRGEINNIAQMSNVPPDRGQNRFFVTDPMPYSDGMYMGASSLLDTKAKSPRPDKGMKFIRPPKMLVSVTGIDEADKLTRFEVFIDPKDVMEETFKIRIALWDAGDLHGVSVNWLAIGEENHNSK